MAEPGQPLADDQIDEIIDCYADLGSKTACDEELEYSHVTIGKYVDQALENGDSRLEHCEDWQDPEEDAEWTGPGEPTPSPVDPNAPDDVPDYSGMSPGDFIEEFFDDFEVGLKKKWVRMQARRADRRGYLPDRETFRGDILNMKSGVSQSSYQEASYIAEEYWAGAQEFMRQTGVRAGGQGTGQQQQPAHTGYGPPSGADPGMQGGGVGQPGVGAGGGTGDTQTQMMQMLLQELRQMRQQQAAGQQGGGQGRLDRSRVELLEDLEREKELLENLQGGDEYVEGLEAQIEDLRREIRQQQGGQQPAAAPRGNESREERLIRMVEQGKMDVDTAERLMDKLEGGHKPVELVKTEREMELKEKELDHEAQKYETFGEAIENAFERIGEGIGSSITGGGGAADEADQPSDGGGEQREPAAERREPQAATDGAGAIDASGQTAEGDQPITEKPCPSCGGGPMRRGPNSALCPDCEHGFAPCDTCGNPVEIPAIGDAEYGRCPSCTEIIELPEGDAEAVDCSECDWTGEYDDLMREVLKCDNCDNLRPIQRTEDLAEQAEATTDFMEQS